MKSSNRLLKILLVLLLGIFSLAAQSAYVWKDKNGVTQMTEYPPPEGEYEYKALKKIDTVKTNPSSKTTTEQKDGTGEKTTEKTVPQEMTKEQKQKNCEIAQHNLATYMRTKKIRNEKGEVVRITDDEWQRRVDETQKKIEEYCN